MITRALDASGDPMLRYDDYSTIHMKGIKVDREGNILKHKSCKGEIQRYTHPPKISPEPKHG
jgi:hypothetical protein